MRQAASGLGWRLTSREKNVDALVVARALAWAGEPVLDRADLVFQRDLQAGLLANFAQGGLFDRLAVVGCAFGQAPDAAVSFEQQDIETVGAGTMNDAACRRGVLYAKAAARRLPVRVNRRIAAVG